MFSSERTLDSRTEGSVGLCGLVFRQALIPTRLPLFLGLAHSLQCFQRWLVSEVESAVLQALGSYQCKTPSSPSALESKANITPERSFERLEFRS